MKEKKYVNIAKKYITDVLSGNISACSYVKMACQRQVDDLERSKTDKKGFPYRFDKKSAEKICKFIELLPHTKGKWAAKKERMVLEPWQIFILTTIFGWVKTKNGLRRFREAYIEVPRKNGKSMLAAGVGLYMLCLDNEFGPEIYSGATSEKQAFEIFRPAKLMVSRTPELMEAFDIEANAKSLVTLCDQGKFEPVVGRPGDGTSPSCALIDEYHEHDTNDLYDTMQTGMDAREQPLLFTITTAGTNLSGPCYEKRRSLLNIIKPGNDIFDETFFGIVYTIDPEDDWTDVNILKKANPNYGVSIIEDNIRASHSSAIQNARIQNTFRTKRLNVWCGAKNGYFNISQWALAPDRKPISDFSGRTCYAGLDLASKIDISALVFLFPPFGDDKNWSVFGKYYLPEDRIDDGNSNSAHYASWAKQSLLTLTPGNITDYDAIEEDLNEAKSMFQILEVPYDPYQATYFCSQLAKNGFPVIEVGQTVKNFSEPMKYLDGLIREKKLAHGNCPVLTWMMSNVTAQEDKKDNVFPNKDHVDNKIDGVTALIMCINRALFNVEKKYQMIIV